ncbi:hypothetical protein ABZ590_15510 [Streptomyces hirsutus]|uniref:hypothetical protein n=1 Tax=Streptomyces hirsutus TaxID=35620 RepID=UPI0033D10687
MNPYGGAIPLGHPVGATGALLSLRVRRGPGPPRPGDRHRDHAHRWRPGAGRALPESLTAAFAAYAVTDNVALRQLAAPHPSPTRKRGLIPRTVLRTPHEPNSGKPGPLQSGTQYPASCEGAGSRCGRVGNEVLQHLRSWSAID